MYLVDSNYQNLKFTNVIHEEHPLQVSRPTCMWIFRSVQTLVKLHTFSRKGGIFMTERLQDYYDYVEDRRHNLKSEEEQRRHNQEQEALTRQANDETARAHQASESIARESNAIQQQSNAWNYDIGSRNANTNSRQADVAEGNLAVNRMNADTTKMKAMQDVIIANKNASTQSRKVMYDNLNAQEKMRIDRTIGRQNYDIALKNVDNANRKLDLAWQEYELNKTDKYWNNVLKSVQTFNSTVDTWTRMLGKQAPSKSIRINQTSKDGKRWDGTVTLKDIVKIMK